MLACLIVSAPALLLGALFIPYYVRENARAYRSSKN